MYSLQILEMKTRRQFKILTQVFKKKYRDFPTFRIYSKYAQRKEMPWAILVMFLHYSKTADWITFYYISEANLNMSRYISKNVEKKKRICISDSYFKN